MAAPVIIRREQRTVTATIAISTTTSGVVDASGCIVYGMIVPSAFTGTTVTFTVCDTSDGTFQALYDNAGSAVSLTVAASRSLDLPTALAAWPYFKIVSGSSEAAARTLKVVMKG